ncbi:MAG: ComF family protein [SAR92 clade bacterium]|uniref:ComF family protein n=1 Tax=SAR92 clade bacterium TaxID=2315479 RepID=A0A520MIV0_9GAMM|nr:MAG: ComF family protein [SAR92 clade bacterium]
MNIKRNPFCPEIEELSRLLAHTIEQAYQGTCIPGIIIPVPLHWRKLMSRGFNQSSSIARIVASHFSHTKVHENLFIRPKHSSPQHLKTKKQRMLDMCNVFTMYIGHNKVQGDAQLTFSGKSVAIVDDVVTTGATVNALARTLLNSGAKYVDIWSIARTGWHNAS